MAHKVFVSYKFADNMVQPMYTGFGQTTVRNYVDVFENIIRTNGKEIYNGEEREEDLKNYSDVYIENHLKDKMYGTSVTVLFISPGMKNTGRSDRDQWIPWEIEYSLRDVSRRDKNGNYRTSHNNAVVAVVLPDWFGNYGYWKTMSHFNIVKKNIDNGYIKPIDWNTFRANPAKYIDRAVEDLDSFPENMIWKTI